MPLGSHIHSAAIVVTVAVHCGTRGCAVGRRRRRRSAGTVMMVMSSLGRFKVGLQTCKSLLCDRKIAGFQGAGQTLIVRIRLAVLPKWLIGRRLRIALQVLLKRCQCTLGGRKIAGLEGAAEGFEVLEELAETVLVGGLVWVGRRRHAGYAAHICFLFNVLLTSIFAVTLLVSAGINRTLDKKRSGSPQSCSVRPASAACT